MLTQLFGVTVTFFEDESGKIKYVMQTKSYDGTSEKDIRKYMRMVMDDWAERLNEKRGEA